MIENNDEVEDSFDGEKVTKLKGLYTDWFLDYASYVILERAIPALEDGLKPVQRRILHAMKEIEDGRYNKVANIVGHTMQYHPHGDASISDALVQIGQKELLVDTQGNWGNVNTGDSAAASRYIEARLTKFALDVVYSHKVTDYQLSYDGRKNEPIYLPVKFPMLLMLGAEGIAVGLSTKILPHNFNELIDASILYLKGKDFNLLPDFYSGGFADFSNYNDGEKGSKVKVRAKIHKKDHNTLIITELPFGITTYNLIESILKANEKGKIKVKKIEDNTSDKVEISVHLFSGVSIDQAIGALYAFTNCEISISPNSCIIANNRPRFSKITEILKKSTDLTVEIHKKELAFQLNELENKWHHLSLEKIFIEEKIYRLIEKEDTWEGVISTIKKGLSPSIKKLKKDITNEDITKLTEIPIKKISQFDKNRTAEILHNIEEEIKKIIYNKENIIDFVIKYFKNLKIKYGKNYPRKTEIRSFEEIELTKVAQKNQKLYVDKKDGFFGTSIKEGEYVSECSDFDDIILFTKSGKMYVKKIDNKVFVEKNIIAISVFKKVDNNTTYNMVYVDNKTGISYVKRFHVLGVTRDKAYNLTNSENAKVIYFTINPNSEAEKLYISLKKRNTKIKLDFETILIKGRASKGNIVSKYPLDKVKLFEKGSSKEKEKKIWFDKESLMFNTDGNGDYLGNFYKKDQVLSFYKKGLVSCEKLDLLYRYEVSPFLICKKEDYYEKSFLIIYELNDNIYYKKISINGKKTEYNILKDGGEIIKIYSFSEEKKLRININGSDNIVNCSEIESVKKLNSIGNIIGNRNEIKKIELID